MTKARFFIFIGFCLIPNICFAGDKKIDFWDSQKKGTNFFNEKPLLGRYRAAKAKGIKIIRLAPNKWLNGREKEYLGDFLLGRPGEYKKIIEKDFDLLKKALDFAEDEGLKVVITMLSLPGNRWRQHNGNIQQRDVWKCFNVQDRAISFWKDLASRLKSHPAVVGYNIKNEPSPEKVPPVLNDWYSDDYDAWYEKAKDTPADLNLFYRKVVAAIRTVDQ